MEPGRPSLIAELQRRRVFRALVAYGVAAFGALQIIEPIMHAYHWPDEVLTWVVTGLAAGFPLVVGLAWIFDVNQGRIERTEPSARLRGAPLVALLCGIGLIAAAPGVAWYFFFRKPAQTAPAVSAASAAPSPVTPSIAVLPFVNMSADPEQEYFSDGMTEELLNALAKVPGLAVTARTSVFSLKGQRHDVREVGKLLGVAYVLEGSVRRAAGEVRITAQLIRAETGFHLWSETYDRKLENIFALQAQLAGAIASALKLPLGIGGDATLVSQRTRDPETYALYLKARAAYRARGDEVKRSIALYREALQRDPQFAPAWAGLAASLGVLHAYVKPEDHFDRLATLREAEATALHALTLAPDLAHAHATLGALYMTQWRWAEAKQHFERALQLAPDDVEVLYIYSEFLPSQGRTGEALQIGQRVIALDPLVPIFRNNLGIDLMHLGRYDEAAVEFETARKLGPGLPMAFPNLLNALLLSRRFDEAEARLEQARRELKGELPPAGRFLDAERLAIFFGAVRLARDPGQRDAVRKELGEAGFRRALSRSGTDEATSAFLDDEEHFDPKYVDEEAVGFLRSAAFARYHADPRWQRLMRKAGFDPEQVR